MIYVSSTPSHPRRDQVGLRTLIRPHMEPINTSILNSFGTHSRTRSSISLVVRKSAKFVVGKSKKMQNWRSLRRGIKSNFWCLSLSLSCPRLGDRSLLSFIVA